MKKNHPKLSTRFYLLSTRFLVLLLLISMFFFGYPVIWKNPRIPPKIKEAQAAISFIGSVEGSAANGGDVTLSLSGLGLQEGDLVIVAYAIGDNDNVNFNMAILSPAGYTEVADLHSDDTQDVDLGVYWKVMGATPDTSVTVDGLGGTDASVAAVAMAFRGVDPATPMDVIPTTATGINTMHPNPPAIDYVSTGVWTVIAGASGHALNLANTNNPYTFPSGYTTDNVQRPENDTSDVTVGLGYRTNPADPEDPGVMTHSGTDSTSYSWAAVTIALRPKPPSTFNQSAYRFFNNLDSTDVGSPLANQNTPASLTSAGQAFRLRLLIHVGTSNLLENEQSFKLQFGTSTGSSCTSSPPASWADVTTSTPIAFNDNPTPADGATLTANTNDPTHGADIIVNQTYEELNNFTNSVSSINAGEDGKWDFSLKDNGAPAGTTYCLRVVKADGTLLDTYSVIPQITTAAAPILSAYRFFNNLDSTDVGSPLANQDTAATLTSAGQAFRLRLLLHLPSGLNFNSPTSSNNLIESGLIPAGSGGGRIRIAAPTPNRLYLVYYDMTNLDLRFCRSTNGGVSWSCNAIESTGDVGVTPDIYALDENNIFITHRDATNGNLRFCKSSNGGLNFSCSILEAGWQGFDSSIKAISTSTIFVSYAPAPANFSYSILRFCRTTDGGNTWNCSDVEGNTTTQYGWYSSLDAVDSNNIYIAHYDGINLDLRFCRTSNGGTTWNCGVIETTGDIGRKPSIKAFNNNYIYIAHRDETNNQLRFCRTTDGGTSWNCNAIEIGGFSSSLKIVDKDVVYIAHFDFTNASIRLCNTNNGGQTWSCSTIANAPPTLTSGENLSLSLDLLDPYMIYVAYGFTTDSSNEVRLYKYTGNDFFKLQYSVMSGTCDTSFSGEVYNDVGFDTPIAFYNNNTTSDASTPTTNTNDPTHGTDTIVYQTYKEKKFFTNRTNIFSGSDGLWDFVLRDNNAPSNTTYCLRVVKADGSLLQGYNVIPQITTAAAAPITCTFSATSTSFSSLSPSAVSTSSPDITITVTSSAGFIISVNDAGNGTNPGLYKSTSPTYLIPSPNSSYTATATLVAGVDGYGIQATTTNSNISINPRYNVSGDTVGGLTTTTITLASSSVAVSSAQITIKHKAAVSSLAPTGNYQDTITYSCTSP
ncbi:hypothetical protein HRbin35_00061 [bacterium HR35]|nr:hypothetical protein HRbin35_00061 [bacterium HR35]